MAHSCLEGREENKETELPEAAEMQRRGHQLWAHTHAPLQTGSVACPRTQHLPSCQPCSNKAGGADSQSHLSTASTNTALCCQTLLGAEPATSHRRSGGRWNWCFDELPPSTVWRGRGEDHCWQHSSLSTPSQQAAQLGSFIFWMNQGLKV